MSIPQKNWGTGIVMTTDRAARRWFVSGLGFIGGTTGYLLALSQSPVVGIALSLLFGLVGGASGLYLAKADLVSEQGRERLVIIGQSVVALSTMLILVSTAILGYLYWIGTQNERSGTSNNISTAKGLRTIDMVVLATLRAQLNRLGVSVEEQREIVERAIQKDTRLALSTKLAAILAAVNATLTALQAEPLIQKGVDSSDQDPARPIFDLDGFLVAAQPLLSQWVNDLSADKDISLDAVNECINDLQNLLSGLLDQKDSSDPPLFIFGTRQAIAASVASLRAAVSSNQPLIPQNEISALEISWLRDVLGAVHNTPPENPSSSFHFHRRTFAPQQ
jgi:hypothetical protein